MNSLRESYGVVDYEETDWMITHTVMSDLSGGYNVLKKNHEKNCWEKAHPYYSFYLCFDAANRFLEEKKAEHIYCEESRHLKSKIWEVK